MAELIWGLLGPETLTDERRVRTLGVGASVRLFNDLAVPGLGGIWFGKQLFLATLGVALAERLRAKGKSVQNIETANAIEALGSWFALKTNGWKPDSRLRGATKLNGKNENDFAFSVVRKPGFYVTQPMRMATVQPLPTLGLVNAEGSRFNGFTCSQYGQDLIDAQFPGFNRDLSLSKGKFEVLVNWAMGGSIKGLEELSTLKSLTQLAREILMEHLIQGSNQESRADTERRISIMNWVESIRQPESLGLTWDKKPHNIDDAHWDDLHAGALFFNARDNAISVLDRFEEHIGNLNMHRFSLNDSIPVEIKANIKSLRASAQAYLDQNHQDNLAYTFCTECVDSNDQTLLSNLVRRDERVLRLRDQMVLPGPAFRGNPIQNLDENLSMPSVAETSSSNNILWPEGISHRVRNLFLLNADLHGDISKWLSKAPVEVTGDEI